MTIEQIRSSDKLWLTPEDISEVLDCNPHSIRVQAHEDQTKLGFPVVVIGTRTRIPRIPFLDFWGA